MSGTDPLVRMLLAEFDAWLVSKGVPCQEELQKLDTLVIPYHYYGMKTYDNNTLDLEQKIKEEEWEEDDAFNDSVYPSALAIVKEARRAGGTAQAIPVGRKTDHPKWRDIADAVARFKRDNKLGAREIDKIYFLGHGGIGDTVRDFESAGMWVPQPKHPVPADRVRLDHYIGMAEANDIQAWVDTFKNELADNAEIYLELCYQAFVYEGGHSMAGQIAAYSGRRVRAYQGTCRFPRVFKRGSGLFRLPRLLRLPGVPYVGDWTGEPKDPRWSDPADDPEKLTPSKQGQ